MSPRSLRQKTTGVPRVAIIVAILAVLAAETAKTATRKQPEQFFFVLSLSFYQAAK